MKYTLLAIAALVFLSGEASARQAHGLGFFGQADLKACREEGSSCDIMKAPIKEVVAAGIICDSLASKLGIKKGDRVLSLNGRSMVNITAAELLDVQETLVTEQTLYIVLERRGANPGCYAVTLVMEEVRRSDFC